MNGRKFWTIGLAVWLLLWGILNVSNIRFDMSATIMGVLAIAIGVLLVFDK